MQAGKAPMVLELLDELGRSSAKARRGAVEALPELLHRAGVQHVPEWLDLGGTLAMTSGAVALKYFKESPLVLGLIETVEARSQVFRVALEMAESDPNVALEFLRRSAELVTILPLQELGRWAEVGLELARVDFVVGIEFLRQIPAVA